MRASLDRARARAIVHVDKHRRSAFATDPKRRSLRPNRPEGETAPVMFRPVSKDPGALPADTAPRSLSTEEVVVLRRSWLVRGSLLGLVAALGIPAGWAPAPPCAAQGRQPARPRGVHPPGGGPP